MLAFVDGIDNDSVGLIMSVYEHFSQGPARPECMACAMFVLEVYISTISAAGHVQLDSPAALDAVAFVVVSQLVTLMCAYMGCIASCPFF